MSLSSTYLSVKELLANNLTSKGVNANKNEGLTTLANKVLDISDSSNLNYEQDSKTIIIGTSDDVEASYSIEDFYDIEEHIDDSAWSGLGGISYSIITLSNGQKAIKRTSDGWSRHGIINVSYGTDGLIPSQSSFYIEATFHTQDGFEMPGLFIADTTIPDNEKFYQIYMTNNGGYHDGFAETGDNARTRWIQVNSDKYITNVQNPIDSQIINKYYTHTFRIFYLSNMLIFEFFGKNQNGEEESRYIYQLPVSNFTPTELGLVLGMYGSRDNGGYNIVFNNVNIVELL